MDLLYEPIEVCHTNLPRTARASTGRGGPEWPGSYQVDDLRPDYTDFTLGVQRRGARGGGRILLIARLPGH